jgi:hypothetical protein
MAELMIAQMDGRKTQSKVLRTNKEDLSQTKSARLEANHHNETKR